MKRSKDPNVSQIKLVIFIAEVLYASLVASGRAIPGQIPSLRYDKTAAGALCHRSKGGLVCEQRRRE
jgi:hypothetical protein